MRTEQILNLDCRKEENSEIIQKVLRQIKPLSKYSDEERIPLEAIEKLVRILCQKYEISPQWMSMHFNEQSLGIYSMGVKTTTDHNWIGNVYGVSLYEIFAKLAIKIYSEVKSGNIPTRTETKEEKQRMRLAKKATTEMEKNDGWGEEEGS